MSDSRPHPANASIAAMLREMARLLEAQRDNPYRVAAFERAADTVLRLDRSLREIFDSGGLEALVALPAIGEGIAAAVAEIIVTGRWGRLDRLRGEHDPVVLFAQIPGVGERLAERIHDGLHVDTLEALEAAAIEGRLEAIPGVGRGRADAIRRTLSRQLAQRRRAAGVPGRATPRTSEAPAAPASPSSEAQEPARHDTTGGPRLELELGASETRVHEAPEPSVALLLEIDDEYRRAAADDALPRIAPRRLNPQGLAWLPVMHAHRDGWHFTALFSNTEQAHLHGRTHDWVVVYFDDDRHRERQRTVVTEYRGELAGRRVVRGREADSRAHYGSKPQKPSTDA
ncbi:MAG: DNA-binding protein [Burkholderiaceae bacterium]|nr:DNA-binding protein [Burkholderiaceae bacterium]